MIHEEGQNSATVERHSDKIITRVDNTTIEQTDKRIILFVQ